MYTLGLGPTTPHFDCLWVSVMCTAELGASQGSNGSPDAPKGRDKKTKESKIAFCERAWGSSDLSPGVLSPGTLIETHRTFHPWSPKADSGEEHSHHLPYHSLCLSGVSESPQDHLMRHTC